MSATHDSDIKITILLAPPAGSKKGFGLTIYLVDKASNTLNGQRTMSFGDVEEINTAQTAGYISAAVASALKVAFKQQNTPDAVLAGNVDLIVPETYKDALVACLEDRSDFYGVTADLFGDTDDAKIVELGNDIEARELLFAFQSGAAALLSDTDPDNPTEGLSSLDGNERSIVCYHDTNSAPMALGFLTRNLAFSPDERSNPWYAWIRGVDKYASQITSGQRTQALADHVNVGLEFGPSDFFVKPGHNLAGRPIYMIVTRDWFKARLQEWVSEKVVEYSERGEKIPVSLRGQRILAGVVKKVFAQGIRNGHFKPDQTRIIYPQITKQNLDDEEIPLEGEATFAIGGQDVTMTFNFQRTDIIESE